ncbi:MAG: c-type cytochrome biogenesis protein CcsB [Pseudanabaenaceae cyanobacterium SKYGB_i_bin29]|nr:c-type cytochrome biogenesis protein CcsB [Pseudanabaenaceae cyanobacterium SKYG29]MDW8422623.1 c-type cytochrome biogenesis protein CcsB [Pseudanabaenaceae cyanobacterium SKYGB_i_bin29]
MVSLTELQQWLDNTSFALLFAAMLFYWVGGAFPQVGQWLGLLGRAFVVIANLAIATLLLARWLEAGYFPLSNLYESLLFVAWAVTLFHLVAEQMTERKIVGIFTSPLATGIIAFAALKLPETMQQAAPLVPALKSNWLMMHVSVMLLSYGALMLGSVLALAFLVVTHGQEVKLSGNSLGIPMNSQPPQDIRSKALEVQESASSNGGNTLVLTQKPVILTPRQLSLGETLDNISYRMIGLGFPLLTIGIIAGGVWANEAWGSYWSWDPKETWSLITWLVFAAYLHMRITKGWQGRKPAILATVGLGVVWTCYLGVNFLGKGLHSYGWFL